MLHFLRHAESVYNANQENKMFNCGLTDKGILQASQLTGDYDLVIVSPLKRTSDTLKYF